MAKSYHMLLAIACFALLSANFCAQNQQSHFIFIFFIYLL
ncbi:hypothetical protein PULV_a3235 [Pseudoalteromonas ulvae UL12]|nr:hypothetical protein [Pseudoalteromonas ulvae UL12]